MTEHSSTLTAGALAAALDERGNPADAEFLQRFFKTGPGEYGEGDVFIGVRVPVTRGVVKRFATMPLSEAVELLGSPVHEHRLAALLVMVAQSERASRPRSRDDGIRCEIHAQYLAAAARGEVDNWDLVDSSAEQLAGRWLRDQPEGKAFDVLERLAASDMFWERRIAMIATFAWIKAGDGEPTFRLARVLLRDAQPLMHKATGWMLREVGTRVDRGALMAFLEENAGAMPRTMLSYATERLDAADRARFRAIPRT